MPQQIKGCRTTSAAQAEEERILGRFPKLGGYNPAIQENKPRQIRGRSPTVSRQKRHPGISKFLFLYIMKVPER